MNKKGFRISLGTRVFLMTSLLLVFALGSIVATTYNVGEEVSENSVNESINNSLALQNYFRQLNDRELLIVLDGFASDPNFSAYVAEAVDTPEGEDNDLASIEDLLSDRKEEAELDFIILLDPEGKVIIHTNNPALSGRDYSSKQFIEPVIAELTEATGIWLENEQMYQVAIMPISIDFELVGFVIAGLAIDKNLANEMKKVGGADTLFLIAKNDQLMNVATTLDVAQADQVLSTLKAQLLPKLNSGDSTDKLKIELDDQTWSVQTVPLSEKENQQIPLFIILSSESKYMEGYDKIFKITLIAAILAIAISIIMSVFLTSSILTPLRKLALATKSAAKGVYMERVGLSGKDELAMLSNSIDSLLSDLRDKQDMQDYITKLSKILPEEKTNAPKVDANQKLPVTSDEYLILAIDVNGMISLDTQPKEALNDLQIMNDIIVAQIENLNGILVRLGNGLFVAAFSIKQAQNSVLSIYSAAGAIDKSFIEQKISSESTGAKYSLSKGLCYVGNIVSNYSWQRFIFGKPIKQATRLLEEAKINRILATNDIYKMIKQPLIEEGISIKGVKGRISGKTLCSLDLKAAHDYVNPLTPEQTQMRQTMFTRQPKLQSSFELTSGSVFAERYEIVSSLGKGSMGLVFKAIDRELNEAVAIKILRKEIAEDKEHLERLRSEIKLARRVTHPNILRTYDLGKVDDTPFLSMEYVRGMTLRYLIDNSGKLPYSAALRVTRQLCDGIDSVHQLGILHRDIKAENVILEPSGNLKLMDFGIARTIKKSEIDSLDEGMFIGTPSYASPEQVQGAELGPASDIYSLGILMTEIFTGCLPITGDSIRDICLAHVTKAPTKPSEFWPDIPEELEKIILRCLQKKPSDRYLSIELLVKDFEVLQA
jgi:methyl-accepting chemotaxis protein